MRMYDMLGRNVSLEWCHDALKASFEWRHNRFGNRCPCSEIPTVRSQRFTPSRPQLLIIVWLSCTLEYAH